MNRSNLDTITSAVSSEIIPLQCIYRCISPSDISTFTTVIYTQRRYIQFITPTAYANNDVSHSRPYCFRSGYRCKIDAEELTSPVHIGKAARLQPIRLSQLVLFYMEISQQQEYNFFCYCSHELTSSQSRSHTMHINATYIFANVPDYKAVMPKLYRYPDSLSFFGFIRHYP